MVYTYDSLGRETNVTEKKADGTQAITVSKRYDLNGNLRFETDGNGNTTEHTYNTLNQRTASTITVGDVIKTTEYTYDKNRNQKTAED